MSLAELNTKLDKKVNRLFKRASLVFFRLSQL